MVKYFVLVVFLVSSLGISNAQNYQRPDYSSADTLWQDSVFYATTTDGLQSRQSAFGTLITAGTYKMLITDYGGYFSYNKFLNVPEESFKIMMKTPLPFKSKVLNANGQEYLIKIFVLKHCYEDGSRCVHGHAPSVEVIFWNDFLGIVHKRLEQINHSIDEDSDKMFKVWKNAEPKFICTTLTKHNKVETTELKALVNAILDDQEFYTSFIYNPNVEPGYITYTEFSKRIYESTVLQSRITAVKELF